jgi:transposase, IS30 family
MASHLTFEERGFLYRSKKKGKSNTEIAGLMGRHPSTISRELRRNTGQRGYRPKQAQGLADERRLASRRPHKMADPEVHQYVQDGLEDYWSPDQIAGRVRRDFPRAPALWLSRQTIYDWINNQAPHWQKLLRRGGRPPEKTRETDRLCPHRRTARRD